MHDAAASATGYLFQCRYALLQGLRATIDKPEEQISIEKFDDIAFEKTGSPTELIQTKHHVGRYGTLTNASTDLWKTLGIWSKGTAQDVELPFKTKCILLTTATAPKDTAASLLRHASRDEEAADKLLVEIASKSKSQENAWAYEAYLNLPREVRLNLLAAISILDNSPNIVDTREEIARELIQAVVRDKLDSFVDRLEGWWFGVVIRALSGAQPNSIPVMSIEAQVDLLREEFKRDSLPVDCRFTTPPNAVVADLDKRPFVQHLRQINVGASRVEYAIRDFYRASEQRSRWAREKLLIGDELKYYEAELIEAWQPRFAEMQDTLTPTCPPERRAELGRGLFRWAEQEALFPFRGVSERFLTHGSYHMLSNRRLVGWHPNYQPNEPSDGVESEI